MVKLITDPANADYAFGQDFNYAVWTEGTVVTLTNVPWNNDYRDVVKFPTPLGLTLDQYIDSNESTNDIINNVSYLKFNVPVRINVPFNKAFKFNYLRVQNPSQPIPGTDELKSYYYFILDVKYVAPNTTELTIQLDIFQSFDGEYTFGNCYIERGHIGIANENAFNNYGRDYLTIPEGIDIGNEYQIITKHNKQLMTIDADTYDNTIRLSFLVVSSVNLEADPGDVNNPHLVTASGGSIQGIASGASYYLFPSATSLGNFMAAMASKPWATQGIISITAVPNIQRYEPSFVFPAQREPLQDAAVLNIQTPIYPIKYSMIDAWRDVAEIANHLSSRYANLKKFFTFPYMIVELTTFSGSPIIIKPEAWNDANGTIVERVNYNPPNQRIMFSVYKYNAVDPDNTVNTDDYNLVNEVTIGAPGSGLGDDYGEFMDMSVAITEFPSVPIVNNGAINYLASNAHGIPFQYQNADWSQTRALRGNETTYDQNKKGIQASQNINRLQNTGIAAQAAAQNLLLAQQQSISGIGGDITALGQAGVGATNGTIGLGGVVGAVGGQVMGSLMLNNQQDQNTRAANITQNISKGSNTAQNNQTQYVNDTNKSLADWSAKGDYENTVAGINAKVQDAKMTQPSVSGQYGGDAFNIANNISMLSMRIKMIDKASIRVIGEYWLRYGYAVRKFANMPSSLKVMTKFTYWKLQETYIASSTMPEGFKQIIRGIFEKGVTVWSNPADIGTIDIADNAPLGGITL